MKKRMTGVGSVAAATLLVAGWSWYRSASEGEHGSSIAEGRPALPAPGTGTGSTAVADVAVAGDMSLVDDSNVAAAAAAPSVGARSSDPRQPVERGLFSGKTLDVARIERVVQDADAFEAVVSGLQSEYFADPDVRELQSIYDAQLEATLATAGGAMALERLACGLSVCAASFVGGPVPHVDFVATVMNSGNAGGARLFSAVVGQGAHSSASPRHVYRVVFATDPMANRMRGR